MTTPEVTPISYLMLVDDSDIDQRLYARIIKRSNKVVEFVQYVDPQRAIEHLVDPAQRMPDLVLLDINMPNINGFEFLDIVTAELGARMCPVIVMLTTSLNPEDEIRARKHSVVREFLNKPLTGALLDYIATLSDGPPPLDKVG